MLENLRKSLRHKFLAATVGTALAALVTSTAILLVYDLRSYERSSIAELRTAAEILGTASSAALAFNDPETAQGVIELLRAQPNVLQGILLDEQGRVFASYSSGPEAGRPVEVPPPGHRVEGNRLVVSLPVRHAGELLGTVFISARYGLTNRLLGYLSVLATVGVLSLLVAAALSVRLRHTLIDPIVTLSAAARRVVIDRDFSHRVRRTTEDELGDLVDSFNAMMDEVGRRSNELEDSNRALALEVNERVSAERALRQADRRKDEFIAVLSHELRNPLAPIRNAVALLGHSVQDPVAVRARDIIDRQSAHLARLIDDLMDVSRITEGKLELKMEVVALHAVVDMALESVQGLIQTRQQSMEVVLPPDPVLIRGDAARLAQVLGNLLNNAAKYTQEGGHILLEANAGDGSATIVVADDGIGIPADAQREVFGMFAQVPGHRAHARGGLGIGLSLVRGLVHMHGGTVKVESEGSGRGSRFTVSLPILSAHAGRPAATEPSAQRNARSLRILVADDLADAAESLAEVLRADGHRVYTAADGLEALRQAEEHVPDAAILDIGMPGMNGNEVASSIRAAPWGKDMLLIALTGWGQPNRVAMTTQAGFDFHMTKPPDFVRLFDLLSGVGLDVDPPRRMLG